MISKDKTKHPRWLGDILNRICPTCKKEFRAPHKYRKYCSQKCSIIAQIGRSTWNKGLKGVQVAWNKGLKGCNWGFQKGHTSYMKGKHHSEETKKKIKRSNLTPENIKKQRENHKGEKNYLWKGENAGYISKHMWIVRWFGKPSKCEHCGILENEIVNKKRRYIQWANKSGKYLRKREDWLALCVKCHKKYDKE